MDENSMFSQNKIKRAKLDVDAEKENIQVTWDDSFFEEFLMEKEKSLDLTKWSRCVVLEVTKEKNLIILMLREENGFDTVRVRVGIPWCYLRFEVEDIVSIKAVWDSKNVAYTVSCTDGFIVTDPDYLVSSTSVVGSIYCQRKFVLGERYKLPDSGNSNMLIGSTVHELFQKCLIENISHHAQVKRITDEYFQSHQKYLILVCYQAKISLANLKAQIYSFVPKISNFLKRYREGVGNDSASTDAKNTFQERIDEIKDIEENIWVPQLGLKGKVDVTVKIHERQKRSHHESDSGTRTLPLELKTGRHTFSLEHTGQLVLYQMMMNHVGHKSVSSGLLLYLKENLINEVFAPRCEQRDLIMKRNELAYYLSRRPTTPLQQHIKIMDLPEPISNPQACEKCPYNVLCCTYLKYRGSEQYQESHFMRKLAEKILKHLTTEEFEYFFRWSYLIALEEEEKLKNATLRHIWCQAPEQRRKNRTALINLKLIVGSVVKTNDRFTHVFVSSCGQEKEEDNDFNPLDSNITLEEYVIISIKNRFAIATGWVKTMTKTEISVDLDRNLLENYRNETFFLDKAESASSLASTMGNLGALLSAEDLPTKLRNTIVRIPKPIFSNTFPETLKSAAEGIMAGLNEDQRRAVLYSLATENYVLLKGLPGTGKTQVLVALVLMIVAWNRSVLITSHTHSAVNNLLVRLIGHKVPFLRIGSAKRCEAVPEIVEYMEENVARKCKSPEELASTLESYNVVGVTCMGINHELFQRKTFDYCIVDEATQVMQPIVIGPLLHAGRFVLVGDPDQLPPVVQSVSAREQGCDESLFARLDSKHTLKLCKQYRMNRSIMKLANDVTYRGELVCGTMDNECASINIVQEKMTDGINWIDLALSNTLEKSVVFINTGKTITKNDEIVKVIKEAGNKQKEWKDIHLANFCEALICLTTIKAFLKAGIHSKDIGLMAPYRFQVTFLTSLFKCHGLKEIEVNTVDQYQGRDKSVILYSCTKTEVVYMGKSERNSEILGDHRRLTVAITRPKHKLIIIGDESTICLYNPFKKMLDNIRRENRANLDMSEYTEIADKLLLNDMLSGGKNVEEKNNSDEV